MGDKIGGYGWMWVMVWSALKMIAELDGESGGEDYYRPTVLMAEV